MHKRTKQKLESMAERLGYRDFHCMLNAASGHMSVTELAEALEMSWRTVRKVMHEFENCDGQTCVRYTVDGITRLQRTRARMKTHAEIQPCGIWLG